MIHYSRMAEIQRRNGSMPLSQYSFTRSGLVSSYDPNSHAVKVMIQPENIESNWIPLNTVMVGNGWGVACAPQIGDQVKVAFLEGDFNSGFVCSRVYSLANTPPVVQAGEMVVQHSSGSLLRFNSDGSVTLTSNGNMTETVGNNLTLNVTGNISATVQGNMTTTVTGTAKIKAASILLQNAGSALKTLLNSAFATWAQNHVHSNGNGGANTGTPTTAPAANTQTTILQAE